MRSERVFYPLLLLSALVVPGTVGLAVQNEDPSVVPYRIVLERQPDLQNSVYQGYAADIRVEDWMSRQQIETLVCHALRDRLPKFYDGVTVHIWWRRVIFDIAGNRNPEATEHIVAAYHWSAKMRPGRLVIWHDQDGNRIRNDGVTFDHLKECGIPAPPVSPPAKPDLDSVNR